MGHLLHALVSWFSKTKTNHFEEKQICSSPASSLHGWQLASQWTTDSEELIAKKENLLIPDTHDFPLRTF